MNSLSCQMAIFDDITCFSSVIINHFDKSVIVATGSSHVSIHAISG